MQRCRFEGCCKVGLATVADSRRTLIVLIELPGIIERVTDVTGTSLQTHGIEQAPHVACNAAVKVQCRRIQPWPVWPV
jgi:hypothetical protein